MLTRAVSDSLSDQLATAALSLVKSGIGNLDNVQDSDQAVLDLFSAFSIVRDTVNSSPHLNVRNNVQSSDDFRQGVETFLQTVRLLSRPFSGPEERPLCSSLSAALPIEDITIRRLKLASLEAKIFAAVHGSTTFDARSGDYQRRRELDRLYTDAGALRIEISRYEAQLKPADTTSQAPGCNPEDSYKIQLERSMDNHARTLCTHLSWAEAVTELLTLVALKEEMISALSSSLRDHREASVDIKESRVQLSKYQRRLADAYFQDENLDEATRWARKSLEIQKSELAEHDIEIKETLSLLCKILTKSKDDRLKDEGERLLFLASHGQSLDPFAVECAQQLGRSYMQRGRYLDAEATFTCLWEKQREHNYSRSETLRTAEQVIISLDKRTQSVPAMEWRGRLWEIYREDFTKELATEATLLAKTWVNNGNQMDARPILAQLWNQINTCVPTGRADCSCPACLKTELWFSTGLLYYRCLGVEPSQNLDISNMILSQLSSTTSKAPPTGPGSTLSRIDELTWAVDKVSKPSLHALFPATWDNAKSHRGSEIKFVMRIGARYVRYCVEQQKNENAVAAAREVYQLTKSIAAQDDAKSRADAYQSCQTTLNCLEILIKYGPTGRPSYYSRHYTETKALNKEVQNLRTELERLRPRT